MACPIVDHKWPAKRSSMFSISWNGQQNLITLWTSHASHHHGLVRFQVSDRKLVKHTTEMILWNMILKIKIYISEHRWAVLFLIYCFIPIRYINLAFLMWGGIKWTYFSWFKFTDHNILIIVKITWTAEPSFVCVMNQLKMLECWEGGGEGVWEKGGGYFEI